MAQRFVALLTMAGVAVGSLLLAAVPVPAQGASHGGVGGGVSRGGGSFGGGGRSGVRSNFGRRSFGASSFGTDFTIGPYGGVFPSNSGYRNGYVTGPVISAQQVTSYYAPPAEPTYSPSQMDNVAEIQVRVPADAEVWFQNVKTSQTGRVRDYVSPSLDTGKSFHYQIRTRWSENGHFVERTRRVAVRANTQMVVDFTRPAAAMNMPSAR